jgi:hypoxanthine-DNA glycosylase
MERSEGFPPIAAADARILILGSLPGERSIAEQQYYAHPQNAFWRIMQDVFGIAGDYTARCKLLMDNGVALWDVLHSSVRPGSMDSNIRLDGARANDFISFLAQHERIERVLCNGRKAGQLFTRMVMPELSIDLPVEIMPSTSPAFAAMRYDMKLEKWRAALSAR